MTASDRRLDLVDALLRGADFDSTRINPLPGSDALIPGVGVIINVHRPGECAGQRCTVHRPSRHHMRGWPMGWDARDKILLRVCPDGVEHPDPDNGGWTHECDGCCYQPVFNEGFSVDDVECPFCRARCEQARRDGSFAALVAEIVAYLVPHLDCGAWLCEVDDWAAQDA